jgi:hypothetical protein
MGDLGGLIEMIVVIPMVLMAPISYHSYILKIIQKLYMAKTKNTTLFAKPHYRLKGSIFQKQM